MGTAKQQPEESASPDSAERTPSADPAGPKFRRGDRTRQRILDAAEEAFGRLGYHNTSIVEITRGAGVGLGTFYVYFPSKIEIYRHLLRSQQETFITAAREATSGAANYREIVRAAFGSFFDYIAEHPFVMRLLRESEFIDPTLIIDLYEGPGEEYRKRLQRAMDLGYIAKTDAGVLAWTLMGMAEFAVLRYIVWPNKQRMEPEQFDAFVDVMVRSLGVTPAEGG